MSEANGYAPLTAGDWVTAKDRGNIGQIVNVYEHHADVHFKSPNGHEATPKLLRSLLEPRGGNGGTAGTSDADASEGPQSTASAYFDDLQAARFLLKIAAGIALDEKLIERCDPEWQEGFEYVQSWPDEGIDGWLGIVEARSSERWRDIKAAIDEAKADPEGGGDPTAPPKPVYAHLGDAIAVIGETRWLWEGWVARSVLNLLAAKGGEGKTRFALDIARRLWLALPMPDGSENPFPAESKTLWILVDRNWSETAEVARNFGVPLEAIRLNSLKETPLRTPELDEPETIAALADQIRDEQPALVVIDTVTYASSRNITRADEAKAAFDGLLQVAAETRVAVLALTHLNKDGEALGRRITERARSVLSLSCPDPEGQPDRRKLWVSKSANKKPPALGVTLRDDGQDYDLDPPEVPEAEGKPRGPAPSKSTKLAEWLWAKLAAGPIPVQQLVEAARDEHFLPGPTEAQPKPSISPLYRAKDRLPQLHPGHLIDEFEAAAGRFNRQAKHWQVIKAEAAHGGTAPETVKFPDQNPETREGDGNPETRKPGNPEGEDTTF